MILKTRIFQAKLHLVLIYNVTVKVDWRIHDEWVTWMLTEHLPEMVNTGCFANAKLMRLLETDENEGPTYTAQYFAENKADYDRYIKDHSTAIRKKYNSKWGDGVIAFRSLMVVIE
jgi:hypothetical protein